MPFRLEDFATLVFTGWAWVRLCGEAVCIEHSS